MSNIIKFPSNIDRSEALLNSYLLENLKKPISIRREDWENTVIPEIKELLKLPNISRSFITPQMSSEEKQCFEDELLEFAVDVSLKSVAPAISLIINLYTELLKN